MGPRLPAVLPCLTTPLRRMLPREEEEDVRNWYPELDIHPDEGGLPLPTNPVITHSMATLIALGDT